MNKNIKKIISGAFCIFMLCGCLDDYRELNTDPELLVYTNPRNVFTGATENFNNSGRGHLTNKYSGVMRIMQYIVYYGGPSESTYVNPSKSDRPSIYTPYYDDYFNSIGLKLRYLVNTVIPMSGEPEKYKDLEAIAIILETYEAWLMYDVNGAAPYEEAFRLASDGIRTPRYELYQKSLNGEPLYKVFDQKIKDKVAVLQASEADGNQYELGDNDYFFKGDVSKWIKFANTLRIKMAQRLEKADATFYKSVLNEVLSNSGGIISAHDESCIYNHPNEYNDNTDDTQILTNEYCAARAFVNYLKAFDDPRLPIMVRRNGFGKGNNNSINDNWADTLATYHPDYQTKYAIWTDRYIGMSANPDSTSSPYSNSAFYTIQYVDKANVPRTMTIRHNSQIESRYYIKNGGKVGTQITERDKEDYDKYNVNQEEISLFTTLITYPETCLMMAEIAFKEGQAVGGKTAKQWFDEGVRSSMEQYQAWAEKMMVPSAMNPTSDNYNPITSAKIDAYLARPEFQTVTLEKIISQQWVNLYMRPEEAWATWKRTGLPTFKDQPEPENGVAYFEAITTAGSQLVIPRRGVLSTPNSENKPNYDLAIEALKEDPNYGADVRNSEGRIWWDKP